MKVIEIKEDSGLGLKEVQALSKANWPTLEGLAIER